MMNLKERIEEIQNKLVLPLYHEDKSPVRYCPECLTAIDQATSDILKAVEESLPEKEEKCQADDNDCLCNDHIKPPLDNPFREGYNQAIDDMKERMR